MSAVQDDGPKLTLLGKLFLLLFVGGCAVGAWWLFMRDSGEPGPRNGPGTTGTPGETPKEVDPGNQTVVRIAYGTEKKRWLVWAV